MPKYRFQLHDDHTSVEPEILDLADNAAARREGVRRAGATLVLEAHKLMPENDWRLDVTNEAETLLYRFDFVMMEAPAAKRSS